MLTLYKYFRIMFELNSYSILGRYKSCLEFVIFAEKVLSLVTELVNHTTTHATLGDQTSSR